MNKVALNYIVLLIVSTALILTVVSFIYYWQLGLILYIMFGTAYALFLYMARKDTPPNSDEFSEDVDPILDAVETSKAIAVIFIVNYGIRWPTFIFTVLESINKGE